MTNYIYQLINKGNFILGCYDLPALGKEDVLVRFLYCGVCGGDYSAYIGRRKEYPISLGHEFVAEVINIGSNVSWAGRNRYVVSDLNFRCGKCQYCKNGKSHLCEKNNIALFTNRGFAKYAVIHNSYLFPISKMIPLPIACFVEPLSCVIHASNYCHISQWSSILINGVGSIGTMFVFYITTLLTGIDIYIREPNQQRLKNILELFPVKSYIGQHTHVDAIIECSNQLDGLLEALEIAESETNMCIMSHLYGENTSFVYEYICKKELNVSFPLRNGNKENMETAIKILSYNWKPAYNILYGLYNDIDDIFKNKDLHPCNKQILDLTSITDGIADG